MCPLIATRSTIEEDNRYNSSGNDIIYSPIYQSIFPDIPIARGNNAEKSKSLVMQLCPMHKDRREMSPATGLIMYDVFSLVLEI